MCNPAWDVTKMNADVNLKSPRQDFMVIVNNEWIRACEPKTVQKAEMSLSPESSLTNTGKVRASGWTGLREIRRTGWADIYLCKHAGGLLLEDSNNVVFLFFPGAIEHVAQTGRINKHRKLKPAWVCINGLYIDSLA